jgi:hypothetical protein
VAEQFCPVFGQSLFCVQPALVALHVPPKGGQFASTVQAFLDVEQVPGTTGHSAGSGPATWHATVV